MDSRALKSFLIAFALGSFIAAAGPVLAVIFWETDVLDAILPRAADAILMLLFLFPCGVAALVSIQYLRRQPMFSATVTIGVTFSCVVVLTAELFKGLYTLFFEI